jgi:hypothetical protein
MKVMPFYSKVDYPSSYLINKKENLRIIKVLKNELKKENNLIRKRKEKKDEKKVLFPLY